MNRRPQRGRVRGDSGGRSAGEAIDQRRSSSKAQATPAGRLRFEPPTLLALAWASLKGIARQPWFRWTAGSLSSVALLGGVLFLALRPPPPPVVEVDTQGFDPLIAAAISQARQAVRSAPRSALARGHLGMVLLAHDVRAPARDCFTQAMALAPREPRWPYFLGLAQLVDNPMAAATNFDRAVRLFPKGATAPRLKLANTLLSLGRLDEAESHFQQVRRFRPDSAQAALGFGKIANARDRLTEAAELLAAATSDPSTRKAAHRLLLSVNQRLGRTNEAARLARTLDTLPNDVPPPDPYLAEVEQLQTGEEAWTNRADELLKAGRVTEAARLLELTLQNYPKSVRAMFFLGRARLRLNNPAGAETVLMRAVELAPDSIEAQIQLGITRLSRGRPKAAQPCFRAALQAKPNLAEAWFNLALSLQAEDERPECIAAFREALRLKPNLIDAYLGLAVALRASGQPAAAEQELQRALELAPSEPQRRKLLDELSRVRLR